MAAVVHRSNEAQLDQLELPFFAPRFLKSTSRQPIGSTKASAAMPSAYQLPLFGFRALRQAELVSQLRGAKRLASTAPSYQTIFLFWLTCQLFNCETLFWEGANRPIRFVPRSLHGYLDRHFPSFVAKRHELFELSVALADMGKTRVGDVVQMSHSAIEELLQGDAKRMNLLIEALHEVGLDLELMTPGWKSPGGIFHAQW